MSLLEILAAIAVSAAMFIGLVDMIDISLEDARGQQAAFHQAQVVGAAQKYIAANYSVLKSNTTGGAVVAVTVPDLRNGGLLPSSFVDSNSYQQNTCVLVTQDSNGKLNALVTAYGGQPIPERSIRAVAMNAGPGAGYIDGKNWGTALGPSWKLDTTPYRFGTCLGSVRPLEDSSATGHLVSSIFLDGPGQFSNEFLYRDKVDGPGLEYLNRMNVPLQMGGTALVNLGDSCPQIALGIENTTKDIVVCDGTKWKYSSSSWKEPVANYAALAAVSKTNGDVRVTRDTGRAFVYNGSTWAALAVDQNGDLIVPRDLPVGRDLAVGRNIAAIGTLHTGGHIYTDSDLHVAQTAFIEGTLRANGDINAARNVDIQQKLTARGYIDAKGDMDIVGYVHSSEVRGKWMAADVIVLDGIENPGGPCNFGGYKADGTPVIINPVGTMLRDANGVLLNCTTDNRFKYANGQYVP